MSRRETSNFPEEIRSYNIWTDWILFSNGLAQAEDVLLLIIIKNIVI